MTEGSNNSVGGASPEILGGPLTVTADPRRPDWYIADARYMAQISFLPGVEYNPNGLRVHRSHLPILDQMFAPFTVREPAKPPIALAEIPNFTPRPFQPDAARFVKSRKGTLLAMEMRTGKTAVPIMAHDEADGPLMVIAPLVARQVWLDWFKKRWPDEEPLIVEGLDFEPGRFKDAKLIFAHYEIITKHRSLGIRIGTLVLDEIHLLSNVKAQRTNAVLMFASLARRVVGLTGTPLWNKPIKLWPVLAAINPGAWGRDWQYGQRYTIATKTAHGTKYDGSANEDELRARLSEVMYKLTWADAAPHLPSSVRTVEIVEIDDKTRFELDIIATAARGDVENIQTLGIGEVARFRKLLGRAKLKRGVDIASQVMRDGQSVVVWTHHRDVAREAATLLEPSFMIHGDIGVDKREAILAAWKAAEVPSALVITLAVGQVAIDLSKTYREIFIEVDFTPVVVAQAEARCFDPSRPLDATYLACNHEVDRKIVTAMVAKTEMARKLGLPAPSTADVFAEAFDLKVGGDSDKKRLERLLAAMMKQPDTVDDD